MTKEQILSEIANSDWQPEFEFTNDLDAVVDSILQPHEDYFLGLHSKVKEIIEREINFAKYIENEQNNSPNPSEIYQITFTDVCNWQKELFEYKKHVIYDLDKKYSFLIEQNKCDGFKLAKVKNVERAKEILYKIENLPNQHINLGLRTTNVKVGNWTPPALMFLEDLKEMCFPISNDLDFEYIDNDHIFSIDGSYTSFHLEYIKESLTQWYKVFETVHFFEDLNGRLGGIVINILSYLLTNKYLIKK